MESRTRNRMVAARPNVRDQRRRAVGAPLAGRNLPCRFQSCKRRDDARRPLHRIVRPPHHLLRVSFRVFVQKRKQIGLPSRDPEVNEFVSIAGGPTNRRIYL